jgi:hypothetical protein
MTVGYRIACVLVLLAAGAAMASSYYGWGLPSDASARLAQSVRQGSLHGRRTLYGGPAFGK